MPYVASTLSSDNHYVDWHRELDPKAKLGKPGVIKGGVLIKGGANVQGRLLTPEGVLTPITEDQAAFLEANPSFQLHKKNGFVKIIAREVAPEKVAKDMKDRDESAPLNEAKGDFKKGGRAAGPAPKTAKVE